MFIQSLVASWQRLLDDKTAVGACWSGFILLTIREKNNFCAPTINHANIFITAWSARPTNKTTTQPTKQPTKQSINIHDTASPPPSFSRDTWPLFFNLPHAYALPHNKQHKTHTQQRHKTQPLITSWSSGMLYVSWDQEGLFLCAIILIYSK